MIHEFQIVIDDEKVDPKVAKNLRDHLKGTVAGSLKRRQQLINAIVKCSTGDTAPENITITKTK